MEKPVRDQETFATESGSEEQDNELERSRLVKRPQLPADVEVVKTIAAGDQLKYSHKAKNKLQRD